MPTSQNDHKYKPIGTVLIQRVLIYRVAPEGYTHRGRVR